MDKRKIDRIDKYMAFRNLNDNIVTKECGLSVGTLNKARNGNGDISRNSIEKILNIYAELNKKWVLFGEGNMIVEDENPNNFQSGLTIPREVFEQFSKLTETIVSQQRIIEKLTDIVKTSL